MTIKNTILVSAAVIAASGFMVTPAQSASVTLRAASCFPIGSPPSKPFEAFVKKTNAANGEVKIKLLGGAPAIGSPFEMVRRMARGAYDVVGCPDAYYGNIVPEVPVLRLSEYSPAENRKNGAWAFFQKAVLDKKNIKLLGQAVNFGDFFLWLSVPIKGPSLKGLHLRVAPVYTPFFKSLGATVQRSNIAQVYTYMENGTVKGFGWPMLGWVPAWAKVTKYYVSTGFYKAGIQSLMNLKKWNSLSGAQKAGFMKVILAHEATSELGSPAGIKKQKAWLASKGVKEIVFSASDRKKWLSKASETGWAEVWARNSKLAPALFSRFTRKR